MQFHLGYVTETIWSHNFYLPLVCHLTSDLKVFIVYTRRSTATILLYYDDNKVKQTVIASLNCKHYYKQYQLETDEWIINLVKADNFHQIFENQYLPLSWNKGVSFLGYSSQWWTPSSAASSSLSLPSFISRFSSSFTSFSSSSTGLPAIIKYNFVWYHVSQLTEPTVTVNSWVKAHTRVQSYLIFVHKIQKHRLQVN